MITAIVYCFWYSKWNYLYDNLFKQILFVITLSGAMILDIMIVNKIIGGLE